MINGIGLDIIEINRILSIKANHLNLKNEYYQKERKQLKNYQQDK